VPRLVPQLLEIARPKKQNPPWKGGLLNRPKPEIRDLDNRDLPENQALSQAEKTHFR
jgi:hypothetical protein